MRGEGDNFPMPNTFSQLFDLLTVDKTTPLLRLLTLRLSWRGYQQIMALLHEDNTLFAINSLKNRLARGDVDISTYLQLRDRIRANQSGNAATNTLNGRLGRGEITPADFDRLVHLIQPTGNSTLNLLNARLADGKITEDIYHHWKALLQATMSQTQHAAAMNLLNTRLINGDLTEAQYHHLRDLILASQAHLAGVATLNQRLAKGEITAEHYHNLYQMISLPGGTSAINALSQRLVTGEITPDEYMRLRHITQTAPGADSAINALNQQLGLGRLDEALYYTLRDLITEAVQAKHPIAYLNIRLANQEVTPERYLHLREVIGADPLDPGQTALAQRLMRGEISEGEYQRLRGVLDQTQNPALHTLNTRLASDQITQAEFEELHALLSKPYHPLSQGIPALNLRLAQGEVEIDAYTRLRLAFANTEFSHQVLQRLNAGAGTGIITETDYWRLRRLIESHPINDAMSLLGMSLLNGSVTEAEYRRLGALAQPSKNPAVNLLNYQLVTHALTEAEYQRLRQLVEMHAPQLALNMALVEGQISEADYLRQVGGTPQ